MDINKLPSKKKMRIKTGMEVEAWITDAATNNGAWSAGEVIEGDGHSYKIRWFDGGLNPARIFRRFVRPNPPPDVKLPKDVVPGDIVELLDCNLWKSVEVARVGDVQFDVRFFGNTNILTVDVSVLRPQLMYGEEGWFLIHKNERIPIEIPIPSRPIAGKNIKSKATGNGIGSGGSNFAAHAFKPGKKRSNFTVDSNIVKDVKRFQGDTSRLVAKLEEPAARYNDNIEVMDVHTSHYLLNKREETGNNVDIYLARRTDSDKDVDVCKSDASSSSSESSSSSSSSSGSDSSDDDCADSAMEQCQQNQEADIQLPPSYNEMKQDSDNRRLQHHRANEAHGVMIQEEQHDSRVHALELEAYMSLMKAFHATGSLNWAKETLLTDLRLHLHVSNEEHLQIIWRFNGKPAGKPRNGHS